MEWASALRRHKQRAHVRVGSFTSFRPLRMSGPAPTADTPQIVDTCQQETCPLAWNDCAMALMVCPSTPTGSAQNPDQVANTFKFLSDAGSTAWRSASSTTSTISRSSAPRCCRGWSGSACARRWMLSADVPADKSSATGLHLLDFGDLGVHHVTSPKDFRGMLAQSATRREPCCDPTKLAAG